MKLSIFIFLLVILIIVTVVFKKALHVFEIMFIWMTVWIIAHSLSSILIENLEVISVSQTLDDFWLHVLKRMILCPLVIIHFIDFFIRMRSKLTQSLLFVINIIAMTALEFLFIHLGVLASHHYSVWMSIVQWTFTITLTYATWYWYRKKYLLR